MKLFVVIGFDNVAKAKKYYGNTKETSAKRMKATKNVHCWGKVVIIGSKQKT